MARMTSGRVRLRCSLHPSYWAPPKSWAARLRDWIMVPIAPSSTRMRRWNASPIVRYVGEVVAVVIAETPYQAADAVQAVRVEYVPLPAAGTAQAALKPGAPRVFDDWPDNVAGLSAASVGEAAQALAGADVVVEARLELARVAGAPIEPRGILVVPEGPDRRLTIWAPTQSPYGLRAAVAMALAVSEESVRVVAADAGGGFGIKGHTYPEDKI